MVCAFCTVDSAQCPIKSPLNWFIRLIFFVQAPFFELLFLGTLVQISPWDSEAGAYGRGFQLETEVNSHRERETRFWRQRGKKHARRERMQGNNCVMMSLFENVSGCFNSNASHWLICDFCIGAQSPSILTALTCCSLLENDLNVCFEWWFCSIASLLFLYKPEAERHAFNNVIC